MNGPHDMGGQHGHGPIAPEVDEPLFHAAWEARALGVTLAAGALGAWSIDESRHARESLPWATYLTTPYYGIWTLALERLVARHDLLAQPRPALTADRVPEVLARGGPSDRPGPAPRLGVGAAVRTVLAAPAGHTRLPAYARGRVGHIVAQHGCHVFPDSRAGGGPEAACPLYTVAFTGEALWGADAEAGTLVHLDLWEPYLVAA